MDTPSRTIMRREDIRDHNSPSPAVHRTMRFPDSRLPPARTPVSTREFPDTSPSSLHRRPNIRNIIHNRTFRTIIRDPVLPRHPVRTAYSRDILLPEIIPEAGPDIRLDILLRRMQVRYIRVILPAIRKTECPETGEASFRKLPTVPDIPVPDMNLLLRNPVTRPDTMHTARWDASRRIPPRRNSSYARCR